MVVVGVVLIVEDIIWLQGFNKWVCYLAGF